MTPIDLLDAPELATLAVLGHLLHVVRMALFARYPHLLGNEHGEVQHYGDPVAELAERLLHRAHDLGVVVDCYRQAAATAEDPPEDDLPF